MNQLASILSETASGWRPSQSQTAQCFPRILSVYKQSNMCPWNAAPGMRKCSSLHGEAPKGDPVTNHRTLDPSRLSDHDFVYLSEKPYLYLGTWATPHAKAPWKDHLDYAQTRGMQIKFPAKTQGFLYWHREEGAPVFASGIRFRVTKSSDVAAFSSGEDLKRPDGRIWEVLLFDVARCKALSPLRTALLRDGLASQELFDSALSVARRKSDGLQKPDSYSRLVWRFCQPFPVRLEAVTTEIWILGPSAGRWLPLRCIFPWGHEKPAYKGRALAQFERSTLPAHRGTRTVVLRLVKIFDLARGENVPPSLSVPAPEEGGLALVRVSGPGPTRYIPYAHDVDKEGPRGRIPRAALKLLFENEEKSLRGSSDS